MFKSIFFVNTLLSLTFENKIRHTMTFDNANYTVKIKLLRLGLLLLTGASVATISMLDDLDVKLGFPRHYISLGILLLYILYNIFRIVKEYNFIYLSTELGKLSIRFYQVITFGKKAKSFEFPLAEFHKYEIEKKGLKTFLIIYRRQDRQIVKYPPLCLNSLKVKELDHITKTLDNLKTYQS